MTWTSLNAVKRTNGRRGAKESTATNAIGAGKTRQAKRGWNPKLTSTAASLTPATIATEPIRQEKTMPGDDDIRARLHEARRNLDDFKRGGHLKMEGYYWGYTHALHWILTGTDQ